MYQWFSLQKFGAGRQTDALFSGMVVPQLVLAVVSTSLSQVLVLLLCGLGKEDFARQAWNFFQGIGAVFLAMVGILFVSASIWVSWIVPGFDQQARDLTVNLTRIQLIGIVFTALVGVCWAAYNAQHQFVWVEVSSVLASVIGLIVLFVFSRFGIQAAAWALTTKAIMQVFFLLPGLGAYYKPDWRSKTIRLGWQRLRPMILGSVYYKTDQIADRIFASLAPAGQLSNLYLAQTLYGAGNQVLNKALAAPILPRLANDAEARDWIHFRRLTWSRLMLVLGLTIFAYLMLLLIGKPVLLVLFQHGK